MAHTRSPRRPPAQWQALMGQWRDSGLSAREFCRQHALGYANFRKWCKRLGSPDTLPAAGDFIDLSALPSPASAGWHIVVHLGDGVEIRLNRH